MQPLSSTLSTQDQTQPLSLTFESLDPGLASQVAVEQVEAVVDVGADQESTLGDLELHCQGHGPG